MSQIEIPRFPKCIRRIILSYGIKPEIVWWRGFSILASSPYNMGNCSVFGKALRLYSDSFQDIVTDLLIAEHYFKMKQNTIYVKAYTRWQDKPNMLMPSGRLQVFSETYPELGETIKNAMIGLWREMPTSLIKVKEVDKSEFRNETLLVDCWSFRPTARFDDIGFDLNQYERSAVLSLKQQPSISPNALHKMLSTIQSKEGETIPTEVLAHMCPRQFNALCNLGTPVLDMELSRTRDGWYGLKWSYFERIIPIEMTNEGSRVMNIMWNYGKLIPKKGGRTVKHPLYHNCTHLLAFKRSPAVRTVKICSRVVKGPVSQTAHDAQETASMDECVRYCRNMKWTNRIVWFGRQWWYEIKNNTENFWVPQNNIGRNKHIFNTSLAYFNCRVGFRPHPRDDYKVKRTLIPVVMCDLFTNQSS